MSNQKVLEVGVIAARHAMPVRRFIFNLNIYDIHAYGMMDNVCEGFWLQVWEETKITDVRVYVTGLTPAVIAVYSMYNTVRYRMRKNYNARDIRLTFMHYDRDTDTYKEQSACAG